MLVMEIVAVERLDKQQSRVREIRKSKGLTQEQIAELINIEPPNVSKMEK